MASRSNRSGGTALPKRRLILLLVLIAALLATLAVGSRGGKSRWAPEFALDLQGGTQIILTPVTTDGSDISQSDVNQAIQIIRQRVDASGVAEAEINSQGGRNIVVGLPGNPSKETRDLVKTSAVLRMRPVLQVSGFNTPLTPSIVSQIEAARAKASQSQSSGAASPSPSPSASSPSAKAPATYSRRGREDLRHPQGLGERVQERHAGQRLRSGVDHREDELRRLHARLLQEGERLGRQGHRPQEGARGLRSDDQG